MPWLADWSPDDPIQVLIFGPGKAGKSWGALTFPRPVVMDFDDGSKVARNAEFVRKYGVRQIFAEVFPELSLTKGIPTAHNGFDDACRFFDEWMKPRGKWRSRDGKTYDVGRDMFDTWVIDSGTSLSEHALAKAVIVMHGMKLSKTHEAAQQYGLVVPKIQDYGSERSLVEQFVDMVKSSGKHFVFICHEKELSDDSGNVRAIVPLLTGKSTESIPLKFDEVYNLRLKPHGSTMKRSLQTEPDSLRRCGSRFGVPNEAEWSWDSLKTKLDEIKALQRLQTTETKPLKET